MRADAPDAPGLRRAAPAKINLYLHVVGRRADGYHRLDGLVAFAGVADTVTVRPADELSLSVTGAHAEALAATPADDNLVLRAARLLRAESGVRAGAAIGLDKALPVAAGLGGGSADAAATLRALAALWRIAPAPEDLARLGLELGADVPVCLGGRAAFVGGIGEQIEPAPTLPPARLVLVNPGIALATKAVYAALGDAVSRPARFAGAPPDTGALAALLAERANDLEAPARRLLPAVEEARAALAAEPGCLLARMSGSGATCFGLFAAAAEADAAARRIAALHRGWWLAAAPLVNGLSSIQAAQ